MKEGQITHEAARRTAELVRELAGEEVLDPLRSAGEESPGA